jgi:hypothetical protein
MLRGTSDFYRELAAETSRKRQGRQEWGHPSSLQQRRFRALPRAAQPRLCRTVQFIDTPLASGSLARPESREKPAVYKGCTMDAQGMYKGFSIVHPVSIPCAPGVLPLYTVQNTAELLRSGALRSPGVLANLTCHSCSVGGWARSSGQPCPGSIPTFAGN